MDADHGYAKPKAACLIEVLAVAIAAFVWFRYLFAMKDSKDSIKVIENSVPDVQKRKAAPKSKSTVTASATTQVCLCSLS